MVDSPTRPIGHQEDPDQEKIGFLQGRRGGTVPRPPTPLLVNMERPESSFHICVRPCTWPFQRRLLTIKTGTRASPSPTRRMSSRTFAPRPFAEGGSQDRLVRQRARRCQSSRPYRISSRERYGRDTQVSISVCERKA
jgi:hypothetical protein